MIGKLLGHILEAQSLPREAQETPQSCQNGPQNAIKTMFHRFCVIFDVFSMIFKSKNVFKLPKPILAKTSKIVLPSRRNAKFQEIEVTKKKNNKAQIDEKSHIFWDIDFKSFWVRFWRGFGRPKTSIFAVFSNKNRWQKSMMFWKAPESVQN